QRDYWYDSARSAGDFISAEALGDKAAERTLARLDARSLSTRECPVLFAPEIARGLVGHMVGAVSGGALYRRASFLLDHAGKAIMPAWLHVDEQPHLRRGHGSGNFDAEGVATVDSALVQGGVLARYVLGSYSARKLGLVSTGNAGGIHNLRVAPGAADGEASDFAGMLRRLGTGLLVTEVMGQGVNTITGDYSRGAAGFWVEHGVIAYPVEEITIAANLRDMYAGIVATGADVDPRSHILCGSILLGRMTVAGGWFLRHAVRAFDQSAQPAACGARSTHRGGLLMSTPSDQMPPPPTTTEASSDDRNLAMLTHLSGFILSVIVPLIVWLMHKDRADKAYLVKEAKEALNFQISVLIGYVICGVLTIILIGALLAWLLWLANLILCIVAAVKVSSDGSYRYPFALRLVS